MICPCCSGKTYEDCCQPFHLKRKIPNSAEQLMRSRYSAYAIPNGDYLWETTLPSERKYHDKREMEEWGKANSWRSLEIVSKPSSTKVEFKACFKDDKGEDHIHHELSTFKKIQNAWFYVSGDFFN